MRGKAQFVAHRGANAPAKLRGYWIKVHQIFKANVERSLVIHVAIFASVVECQHTE